MNRHRIFAVGIAALVSPVFCSAAHAVTAIWNGPDFVFSKASGADFTLPANQDVLTPNVKLTRGNTQGMINIALESSFTSGSSPAGTTWATDLVAGNGSQAITATNFAALTFTNWNAAYLNSPGTNILNRPAVVHLVADDIYLNLKFTAFQGGGTGGAFTYVRSTPIPEPGTLVLAGIGAVGAVAWNVRRRRA